jgi:xylitol oxidase
MAGDDYWLSMNYKEDCIAFHFTWFQDWPAVSRALDAVEAALSPLKPRPHWGKLFTMDKATLQSRYERLADFRALATKHDPNGKFRNAFVDEYVF